VLHDLKSTETERINAQPQSRRSPSTARGVRRLAGQQPRHDKEHDKQPHHALMVVCMTCHAPYHGVVAARRVA